MTGRREVVATTSFATEALGGLVGKHPAVVPPGVIQQGTRLWSDDPIVLASPSLFVGAETVPGAERPSVGGADDRWRDPEWLAIVKAYRRAQKGERAARPSQPDVAREMDVAEGTLRTKLRGLDIPDYRAVHALIQGHDES